MYLPSGKNIVGPHEPSDVPPVTLHSIVDIRRPQLSSKTVEHVRDVYGTGREVEGRVEQGADSREGQSSTSGSKAARCRWRNRYT